MFSTRALWPLMMALVWSSPHAATIEQLVAKPTITQLALSPFGTYIAARVYDGERYVLHVFDRETLTAVGGFEPFHQNEVGTIGWASEAFVVGSVLTDSRRVKRRWSSDLFAVRYDGERGKLIHGPRRNPRQLFGLIIDYLPQDDRHVLLMDGSGEPVKLDIMTGESTALGLRPEFAFAWFTTDLEGQIRVIASVMKDQSIHLRTLPDGARDWVDIDPSLHGKAVNPVAISLDNKTVFTIDDNGEDLRGIYRLAMDGSSYEKIYVHERVDVARTLYWINEDNALLMAEVEDGYPGYILVSNPDDRNEGLFVDLWSTFPRHEIGVESCTMKDEFCIVKVSADVDEGTFYLLDQDKHQVTRLFSMRPGVQSDELATIRPVEFTSYDKILVPGYFTRGKGEENEVLPMVVLVHDGPGARDYWQYDEAVQVLATRGYSVLQINYRGSSGYGRTYKALGNREWGDAIQQDIISGTRWAIDEKLAKSGKICIIGTGFGAYSALMSATLAPDLYRCVIATSGFYDLTRMTSFGDSADKKEWWKQRIGDNEDELTRFSPINHVERLQAPILIAHGRWDEYFKQASRLKEVLEKNNKPYVWFVKERMGHRVDDDTNRLEYLNAVLDFLSDNL